MSASKTKKKASQPASHDETTQQKESSAAGTKAVAKDAKAQSKEKKAPSKASKSQKNKGLNKNGKPKLSVRIKEYFAGVRSELKRVVWPTREELIRYTMAVVGMLVFFGLLIGIVDALIVPALDAFARLGR